MWSAMPFRIPDIFTTLDGSGSPASMAAAPSSFFVAPAPDLAPDSAKPRTSASTTLPRGPVAVTCDRLTPSLAASLRAPGVDGVPPPAALAGAARLAAGAAADGPEGAIGLGASGTASPSASR